MTGLARHTALITGAGGGIGATVALTLAEAGASVALTDLTEESLQPAAERLAASGHTVMTRAGDLTDADTATRIVGDVVDAWEHLDILVNCAGICPSGPFEDTTIDEWEQVFAVNVTASFLCCREAIRHMKDRRGGSIVNVSSNAGKTAEPYIVPYSASKFAVVGLTQGLALEFAAQRIRVNCVCPAMCETPMMESLADEYARLHGDTPESQKQGFHAEIPWGRMARPADIAHAVLFLVDPASEFITGQALNVSGGLEMH